MTQTQRNTTHGSGPQIPAWMPKIAPELSNIDGAQGGPAPFLDPFARARRERRGPK